MTRAPGAGTQSGSVPPGERASCELSLYFVEEETGAKAISVATDGTNGPLVGYITTSGAFYAKEGALRAAWVEEHTGAGAIALASDGINGPLIGYLNSSRVFYAKEGSLGRCGSRKRWELRRLRWRRLSGMA